MLYKLLPPTSLPSYLFFWKQSQVLIASNVP